MIESLHISNYALISNIDIDFHPGMNIITGETGAGKSIILGALSLILGGRANLSAVRNPERKTIVEAIFEISRQTEINEILLENQVDTSPEQCILRRELTQRGGSRAFINDTPVTLPLLRKVALQLIDIHSQHQNLLLAEQWYQLTIIDALAANQSLIDEYTHAFNDYRVALRRYRTALDTVERTRADAEFLTFQAEQLDALNLQPGELADLEQQRLVLQSATHIHQMLQTVEDALQGENDVAAALQRASDALSDIADIYPEANDLAERLRTAKVEVQDIAETSLEIRRKVNGDPTDLESVEERLSRIYTMQTRFNVDTEEKLIAIRKSLHDKLRLVNDSDDTIAQLETVARAAKKQALTIARTISARRIETAAAFADELRRRAIPLGMNNLRVEISLAQSKMTATGIDTIDFLFAFNKSQPLQPLARTASGGETSRLVLAIKSIMAEKMKLPTIIFDEVDTGVSGDIANRMASLMADIAGASQVITITHLPQVAAYGQRHFKVYKEDDSDSTTTHIKTLDIEGRLAEMALMVSGNPDDVSARETARRLIENAAKN